MPQCSAKQQYSDGKQCQRPSLPGKTKCARHGSGGCKSAQGRAAIAAARSKGLKDSRADRLAYQKATCEMYMLARFAGITWIGRPPKQIHISKFKS